MPLCTLALGLVPLHLCHFCLRLLDFCGQLAGCQCFSYACCSLRVNNVLSINCLKMLSNSASLRLSAGGSTATFVPELLAGLKKANEELVQKFEGVFLALHGYLIL